MGSERMGHTCLWKGSHGTKEVSAVTAGAIPYRTMIPFNQCPHSVATETHFQNDSGLGILEQGPAKDSARKGAKHCPQLVCGREYPKILTVTLGDTLVIQGRKNQTLPFPGVLQSLNPRKSWLLCFSVGRQCCPKLAPDLTG